MSLLTNCVWNLQWILHDWSDEHCLTLLKNCHKALQDSGKVILAESALPAALERNVAASGVFQLDMVMLAHNPGGKERTHRAHEVWVCWIQGCLLCIPRMGHGILQVDVSFSCMGPWDIRKVSETR